MSRSPEMRNPQLAWSNSRYPEMALAHQRRFDHTKIGHQGILAKALAKNCPIRAEIQRQIVKVPISTGVEQRLCRV